jgi:hypothetical protein
MADGDEKGGFFMVEISSVDLATAIADADRKSDTVMVGWGGLVGTQRTECVRIIGAGRCGLADGGDARWGDVSGGKWVADDGHGVNADGAEALDEVGLTCDLSAADDVGGATW